MSRITSTVVPISTLANGAVLQLHLHEVVGSRDGPTLGLLAGVNGDQTNGVEIVRRALEAAQNHRLHGRVLALPVANPHAYQMLSRHLPIDATNLNRVFPGNQDGWMAEQLAHAVYTRFVSQCDVLLAFHSGGSFETTDYTYVFDDLPLAKALGSELLVPGPTYVGSLGVAARSDGIPLAVSELGGGQQRPAAFIAKGLRGTMNVMKHLGMREGEMVLPPTQLFATEYRALRPHHGGILLSRFGSRQLGARVARGGELGRVISPYTFEQLESIVAPYGSSILGLSRERVAHIESGNYAYMVADAGSATKV